MLTDGSPNIPPTDADGAAYTSVTIVTLGMGVACATSTSTNCLNRELLNTMASDPASSYSVLLLSYCSLSALPLFISSQCKAQIVGTNTVGPTGSSPAHSPPADPPNSHSPLPTPAAHPSPNAGNSGASPGTNTVGPTGDSPAHSPPADPPNSHSPLPTPAAH
eukprot:EG_transcript_23396